MLKQQPESALGQISRSSRFGKILMGLCLSVGVLFAVVIAVVVANSISIDTGENESVVQEDGESNDFDDKLAEMKETEEFILSLARHVPRLKDSILNLKLPDVVSGHLFATELKYNDLSSKVDRKKTRELKSFSANRYDWNITSALKTGESKSLSLWRPFLQDVDYFEQAKFYIVKATKTVIENRVCWQTEMGFQGKAKKRDGRLVWVHGSIDSLWQRNENAILDEVSDSPQVLSKFFLKDFHTWEIPQTMFAEVLDAVVSDEDVLKRVRHSQQEQYCIEMFLKEDFEKPHPDFRHTSETRHPAVSVVDLDGDGFDDIYVMPQWGKNSFLRNRGDGTFEEIAQQLGLAIENHCSSAAFADFDNDGDLDLFLGRTLAPSMYLQNDGGKFQPKPIEGLSDSLPGFVSSISVADYNKDGLLDVFIANYYVLINVPEAARKYLDVDDYDHYQKIYGRRKREGDPDKKYHITLNQIGPPNRLLVNLGGGKFGISPESKNLETWRNSFQATWADYDEDGDPDLYIANDFAPNNLYRNDDGKFVDVTEETGTSDIGFGMGASWGDYDNDGKQDLYISNMYSKAGRRITAMVPNLDSRISAMARGNTLFRNLGIGQKFEKVSGLDAAKIQVEKAGWSWGSQFADFNNDGRLDLYALSGHFTVPKIVELRIGEEGADV